MLANAGKSYSFPIEFRSVGRLQTIVSWGIIEWKAGLTKGVAKLRLERVVTSDLKMAFSFQFSFRVKTT